MSDKGVSYHIITGVDDIGFITQELVRDYQGESQKLNRWIIDTRDKQIVDSLIQLGWIPPRKD